MLKDLVVNIYDTAFFQKGLPDIKTVWDENITVPMEMIMLETFLEIWDENLVCEPITWFFVLFLAIFHE